MEPRGAIALDDGPHGAVPVNDDGPKGAVPVDLDSGPRGAVPIDDTTLHMPNGDRVMSPEEMRGSQNQFNAFVRNYPTADGQNHLDDAKNTLLNPRPSVPPQRPIPFGPQVDFSDVDAIRARMDAPRQPISGIAAPFVEAGKGLASGLYDLADAAGRTLLERKSPDGMGLAPGTVDQWAANAKQRIETAAPTTMSGMSKEALQSVGGMLPMLAVPGEAMPTYFGAQGAGARASELANRNDLTPAEKERAIAGSTAINAAAGAVRLPIASGIAKPAAAALEPYLGETGSRVAARAIGMEAEAPALNAAVRLGENAVTRGSGVDPDQSLTQGVGQAAAVGALTAPVLSPLVHIPEQQPARAPIDFNTPDRSPTPSPTPERSPEPPPQPATEEPSSPRGAVPVEPNIPHDINLNAGEDWPRPGMQREAEQSEQRRQRWLNMPEDSVRKLSGDQIKRAAQDLGVHFDTPSLTIPRILDAQEAGKFQTMSSKELWDAVRGLDLHAGTREQNIEALIQHARTNTGGTPVPQENRPLVGDKPISALQTPENAGLDGLTPNDKNEVAAPAQEAAPAENSAPKNAVPVEHEQAGSNEANKPENTGKLPGRGGVRRGAVPLPDPAHLWGEKSFVGQDVAPTLKKTAENIYEAYDDIRRTLAPAGRSADAGKGAGILREMGATLAQRADRAEAALHSASWYFAGQDNAKNLSFIDAMENGRPQGDPKLQVIADTMRKMLDERPDEVIALGKGKLQHYIQDYFPHIWKDADKNSSLIGQLIGKRPMEGSKSFLKQRSIPTTADGVAMGLEPISYNPVDLVLLKIREMDRYILAQKAFAEGKGKGILKFVRAGEKPPEGYAPIDDKIATVYGPPTVKVNEWQDPTVYEGLQKLAGDLGIQHDRKMGIGPNGRSRALGLSYTGQDKVETRFATPESVLAHEIGHQMDEKYGMYDRFFNNPDPTLRAAMKGELRKLADLRNASTTEPEGHATAGARKRVEQIAHIMQAYIGMRDRFQKVAPRTFREFERMIYQHPELQQIKDIQPSLNFTKIQGEKAHGGMLIMGAYHAPEPVATVFNNYLSPGLRGKSGLFRAYLGMGNTLNQAQLGISGFHIGTTTINSVVSRFALGLEDVLNHGEVRKGLTAMASSTYAPLENLVQGDKVLKEWVKPGSQGAEIAKMVDAMQAAGGRAKADEFYRTKITENMIKAFKSGNIVGGVVRAPFAGLEQAAKPVLEWMVPRMKMGAFLDMARREMEKLPPSAGRDEVRDVMGKAWDSVDSRFGQLVYDNLFWNKMAKDLAMATTRSVGWNLGTIRELGGGAIDLSKSVAGAPRSLARGNGLDISHRAAYTIALPLIVGGAGAILHRVMTGKNPEELKDYFYPQTGETDANGDPIRIALPSYMKDMYAYGSHPLDTLGHKAHPMVSAIAQMLENKDYYGDKIRNEDDPPMKQIADEAKFAGKQFTPFAVENYGKMADSKASIPEKAAGTLGVTQAPRSITETSAEAKADQISRDRQPVGGRTTEQAQKSKFRGDLMRDIRNDTPGAVQKAKAAEAAGTIPRGEARKLQDDAKLTSLQRKVKGYDADSAVKIWALANTKERNDLRDIVSSKIMDATGKTPDEKDAAFKKTGIEPPPDMPLEREFHGLESRKTGYEKTTKDVEELMRQYKAQQERGDTGTAEKTRGKLKDAIDSAPAKLGDDEEGRLEDLRHAREVIGAIRKIEADGSVTHERATDAIKRYVEQAMSGQKKAA